MDQSLRQRFLTPTPDDRFVADMLLFLARKFNAPQCAHLKLKVVHYPTMDSWMWLLALVKSSLDHEKLRREYREPPKFKDADDWREVNCLLLQVIVKDVVSGTIAFANEERREQKMNLFK